MNLEELKAAIAAKLDEVEFLDIIGYTIEDLVEKFEDQIEQNEEAFTDAVAF